MEEVKRDFSDIVLEPQLQVGGWVGGVVGALGVGQVAVCSVLARREGLVSHRAGAAAAGGSTAALHC